MKTGTSALPMQSNQPELSVLIPCHNGAQKIENVILDWVSALEPVTSFEVVVINDGSNDGSARILDFLRRETPQLRILHQLHTGQAQALRRGYEVARGTYVLELPLQVPFSPDQFWPMWERRLSYQLLVAFPQVAARTRWWTRWLSTLFQQWMSLLFQTHFRTDVLNVRLTRAAVLGPALRKLPRQFESIGFGTSVLVHKEYPFGVREVPVSISQPGLSKEVSWATCFELLQLWWSSRKPWFFRARRNKSKPLPTSA